RRGGKREEPRRGAAGAPSCLGGGLDGACRRRADRQGEGGTGGVLATRAPGLGGRRPATGRAWSCRSGDAWVGARGSARQSHIASCVTRCVTGCVTGCVTAVFPGQRVFRAIINPQSHT